MVLRLQNVYGPGQSLINPYTGIMSLFCRLAKAGGPSRCTRTARSRRDFVLIDDVARALVAALEAPPSTPVPDPRHRLGVRTRPSRSAAELIAAHYGAPAPHVTGQYRDGDVRHAACDVQRTVDELDWKPQWTLTDGVAALQDWIEGQLA